MWLLGSEAGASHQAEDGEDVVREHGLPFADEMIRALLAKRKWQTRRLARIPEWATYEQMQWAFEAGLPGLASMPRPRDGKIKRWRFPYAVGDVVWAREAWVPAFARDDAAGGEGYLYRATNDGPEPARWRPSIFMPRGVARIVRPITGVRLQRVEAVSEADAKAVGMWGKDVP